MSLSEPDPNISQIPPTQQNEEITIQQKPSINPGKSLFFDALKSTTKKWLLITYEAILSIFHVTFTMGLASLGVILIITGINWIFGDPGHQSTVIQKFLEGLKIFSIFGIAATYSIYLIYALLEDVRLVRKITQEDDKEQETTS